MNIKIEALGIQVLLMIKVCQPKSKGNMSDKDSRQNTFSVLSQEVSLTQNLHKDCRVLFAIKLLFLLYLCDGVTPTPPPPSYSTSLGLSYNLRISKGK